MFTRVCRAFGTCLLWPLLARKTSKSIENQYRKAHPPMFGSALPVLGRSIKHGREEGSDLVECNGEVGVNPAVARKLPKALAHEEGGLGRDAGPPMVKSAPASSACWNTSCVHACGVSPSDPGILGARGPSEGGPTSHRGARLCPAGADHELHGRMTLAVRQPQTECVSQLMRITVTN